MTYLTHNLSDAFIEDAIMTCRREVTDGHDNYIKFYIW